MANLRQISLKGFKSIKSMDLELRSMNVLIGINGAGKSNVISFFRLLNEMMGARLQEHVATSGRAHSILHFGPKVTPTEGKLIPRHGSRNMSRTTMRTLMARPWRVTSVWT